MDPRIQRLLKKSEEFNNALKKNELSLVDILINDICRLVVGKLVYAPISRPRLIGRYLRDALGRKEKLVVPESLAAAELIIFATEPTHLKQAIPVFEQLRKGLRVCFVVTKSSLLNELVELSAPAYFLDPNAKAQVVGGAPKLILPDVAWLSEFQIDNSFLKDSYDRISSLIDQLNIVTSGLSLKAVLIGNDTTTQGRVLSLVSKAKDIPTYAIQHGLITGDWTHRLHNVGTFFVFGPKSKNTLIENGLPNENIVVTGAPYLDSFSRDDVDKVVGSDSYILILLSGYGHGTSFQHYLDILSLLFRFFKANSELSFVVKLHRKENAVDYESRIREFGLSNVRVIENNSNLSKTIFHYIAEAGMVITGNSYTALESMLMSKPVISIDLQNEYSTIDFISQGAVLKVTNYEALVATVENIGTLYQNQKEIRRRVLEDYFFENDGKAAFRISNHLCGKIKLSHA